MEENTDIAARDLSARAITRTLAFANHENFATRLNREVQTRLDHLGEAWANFKATHSRIMGRCETMDTRADEEQVYDTAESEYLEAYGILQERMANMARMIAPSNHGSDDEQSDVDQQSNFSAISRRQNDRQIDDRSRASGMHHVHHNASTPTQNNTLGQSMMPVAAQSGQPIIVYCGSKKVDKTWSDFDGTPTQWQMFHDLFKAAVHDNPSLTAAEKFAQLKLSLKGRAASALGDYALTDQNFAEAWKRLTELYQCDYNLSKELLAKFHSLPKLTHANANMIQRFSNVTHQVIRQLKTMQYPTEGYDMMFVHSLHEKLDPATSYEWSKERTSERPSIEEMLKFLDRQAKHLAGSQPIEHKISHENRKRHSASGDTRNDSKKAKFQGQLEQKSSHKTESRNCKVCRKEQHGVHRCPKFIRMDLAARRRAAKDHNLCYNCLSPSHTSRDCNSSTCKRCDKKHNSLLCAENPANKTANAVRTQRSKGGKRPETATEPTA